MEPQHIVESGKNSVVVVAEYGPRLSTSLDKPIGIAKDDYSSESKPPASGTQYTKEELQAMIQQSLVMGGENYDPNRIPASVFSSQSTTPLEWSSASNDSLFSIHMGTNSFSKDSPLFPYKSGESPNYGEIQNVDDPNHFPIHHSPSIDNKISEIITEDKGNSSNDEDKAMDDAKQETHISTGKVALLNRPEKKGSPDNMRADDIRDSTSSACSFQFPLLATEDGRSSQRSSLYSQQEPEQETPPRTAETHAKNQSQKENNSKMPSCQEPEIQKQKQESKDTAKSFPQPEETLPNNTPKAQEKSPTQNRWLSWFSCGSFGGYCKCCS